MPRIKAAPLPRRAAAKKQPYQILVATAGEPESLGAIHIALALARRKRARIHVLAVTTPFPHGAPSVFAVAPPVQVDESNRRATLEQARSQLATVRGTKDWAARAVVGWPADCIVDTGTRWPASLIVVGAGKHGSFDRLIGSETAVKVVRRSTVPVLVVPQDVRHLPKRAVAAIDFADSSINAATLAASLLGPDGVLVLLHASTLIKEDPKPGTLMDIYTAGAVEKLDDVCARVHRETRREVHGMVVGGAIVDRLLSYVESAGCDLLALGGHDLGVIDRFLLGSVRASVLRHAPCAVLIAPHAIAAT
jgi:nucleotide-binding universal stress UspA family protein